MVLYFFACFTFLITFTNQFDDFRSLFDRSRNHVTAPPDLEDLEPGSYDDILQMNPDRHHDPQEIYDILRYSIPAEMESSIESSEEQPQATRQTDKMCNESESKTLSPYELAVRADKQPAVGQKYKVYQKSPKPTVSPYSDTYYNESLSGRRAYTRDYPKSKGIARDERKKGQPLEVRVWDFERPESFKMIGPLWNRKKVRKPFGTNSNFDYILQGSYITSCYNCGHLEYGKWWKKAVDARVRKGKLIPNETLCTDAFDSEDWRARTKRRYLRQECFENTQTDPNTVYFNTTYDYNGVAVTRYREENYNTFHDCVKVDQDVFGEPAAYHSGQPLSCFGPYVGKCFKRFLDVGKVYTERGCSSWPPHKSNTFASHRFEKLEYLLHDVDEGCVSSPMASLTPFGRSVSLYSRYHVCVCTGSYCNAAMPTAATGGGGGAVILLLLATF